MWTSTLWNHSALPLQWGVVITASLVAAAFDARSRRIPNRLTGPLVLTGLIWATCLGGLAGLADATVACVAVALPFLILFVFAGGGAGDAKLMGAVATWLGITGGLLTLVCVTIAGGALAIVFATARGRLKPVMINLWTMITGMMVVAIGRERCTANSLLAPTDEKSHQMPYGIAIAVGVCAAAIVRFTWIG